ncbi:hypothetical protein HJA82_28905 [Rhizobium bangladeshense]|uniref:Acb2/Tad1 domain-containing protein n=1 Tax=Rhizobium bangladeshense TaxID=1138189 RepID=UPI001C82CAB0|nr:hypothetical protein [Rhizobium bangladeshense]MBX4911333.1 hypothetical protein [Rhizobium bangladeshense]
MTEKDSALPFGFPLEGIPLAGKLPTPGVKHLGLPVAGYQAQSDENVALVNENKVLEERVLRQIDRHVRNHGSQEIDQRMVALARTKIQEGFMWLNRAVFQPKRIPLPEDAQ